jgi:hypothetical protein
LCNGLGDRLPSALVSSHDATHAAHAATHEFDRATAVLLRRADDEGAAVHDVDIDAAWSIGDKPNGGYLLAIMARAAVEATAAVEGPDHPHAQSAAAAYVRPPSPGPAEVHSEVLRRGRGMSQVRARLVQEGAPRVDATFTVGRLRTGAEPWWGGETVPDTAEVPAEGRTPTVGPGGVHLPIMERVDIRLDPATAGFALGQPAGVGEIRARLRFADGRAPDPLALLYVVDALPPATFDLAGTTGWVPTLSLSVYVRAVPAAGPLVVRHRAGLVEARTVDEVCHVWDSRGRLVAQATQLAGIRTS